MTNKESRGNAKTESERNAQTLRSYIKIFSNLIPASQKRK